MEHNKEILQELAELTPLLVELQKRNPYSISPDYFNNLPEQICLGLHYSTGLPDQLTKTNPYTVPSDYFNRLPEKIVAEIQGLHSAKDVHEELEIIAPVLNTIKKEPVYRVPGTYFSELTPLKRNVGATEINVAKLLTGKKIIKYAAAAVVLGVISTRIIFNRTGNRDTTRANNAETHTGVQKLTEQEIITFLKTTSPSENLPSTNVGPIPKNSDITISVSKIPDEEIKQFLKENGVEVEM